MDDDERRLRLEALFTSYAGDVLAYARRRIDAATAEPTLLGAGVAGAVVGRTFMWSIG